MRKSLFARMWSLLLAVVMVIGMIPATMVNAIDLPDGMSVVSENETTLAPGVTQNQVVLYNDKSERVEMFVTKADMSVDTVKLFASYKDMDPTNYGMSKLTEQVDAFNKKAAAGDAYYQGTVVAGINASYYNMTTGKPTGTFVMNGIDVTTESEGNKYGYFAVMKDGSVKIGNKGDYSADKGNIQEAIGIYTMLIVDGQICSGLNTTQYYPRQTIGITADGDVILMTADGNQAPKSVGLTVQEQAQVMLDLGCVWAGHLDGGGSCTYASKPEGSDDFVITNSPSDGSERSVSNGFIIVSTAVASYSFDHVVYEAENSFMTPGTSVEVSVTGASSTGNAADVPADITYETTNGTYVDGVFTAGSEIGTATITAMYDGKAAGSVTLNVVQPDTLEFKNTTITVPYGKTVPLGVVAKYGVNEIAFKVADITVTMSDDAIGTVDGLSFTACAEDETVTGGTVTVALVADAAVTAASTIVLGKGSEVLNDFEHQSLGSMTISTGYPQYGPMGSQKDANGNYYYNGQNELGEIYIVDGQTGKVHDGNYALAVECDFTQPYETGYHLLNMSGLGLVAPAKAQTIGMWLYVPELEELYTTSMRFVGTAADGTTVNSPWLWDNCEPYGWSNDGWRYVTMDISGYAQDITFKTIQFYICDRDNSDVGFYFKDHASVNSKFTYYIDNITVDYSSAVDDREPPVFEYIKGDYSGLADAVALTGQTIDTNKVGLSVKVTDDMTKINYTGLDISSAKVYVDGVLLTSGVTCTVDGMLTVEPVTLADGVHTFRVEICDMMGNLAYAQGQINVAAGSELPTVSIVPQKPDADRILIGSVYWVDLVATDAKNVETTTVVLNLNSVSQWELDHMVVTAGFEAEYTIDEINNNATITVTKTGKVDDDATVLVQLPIRTWESRLTEYEGYEAQTPEKLWSRKIIWPMDIKLSSYYGTVTFTDGTTGSFSMEKLAVITELYGNYGEMNSNGNYSDRTSWHIHTAEAMADKAATCTEDGYTGRTYCAVCDSVVDWGTTIPATGHTYELTDGVLQCVCGDTFTGVKDGVSYVDGIAAEGWIGESYYVDGMKLTGIQLIDGYYYDLGTDGISTGKYTGLYNDGTDTYYVVLGELKNGWQTDGTNWYYFDLETNAAYKDGRYTIDTYKYTFDADGILTLGEFVREFRDGELITRYMFAGKFIAWQFFEIGGETYYFYRDATMATGTSMIQVSRGGSYSVYEFDENGVYHGVVDFTGVYEYEGKLYALIDGEVVARGAFEWDGGVYFADWKGIVQTGKFYVDETNDVITEAGYYYFDETGKMYDNAFTEVDGQLYYMVGGQPYESGASQVIAINGEPYFVNWNGRVSTGKVWVDVVNDYTPVAGYYYFDETGRMYDGEFAVVDGASYYMVGGQPYDSGISQVIEIDGALYFVNWNGRVSTGKVWVDTTNEYAPVKGYYYFDETGRMYDDEFTVIDGSVYYLVGGQPYNTGISQVIQVGDALYFVNWNGRVSTGKVWVDTTNEYAAVKGYYYFDETGRMYDDEFAVIDGSIYYLVGGQPYNTGISQVIQVGDALYFVNWNGRVSTGKVWVDTTNEYAPTRGYYYFDETGRMYDDEFATIDGSVYYMVGGLPYKTGSSEVMQIGGALYFVNWNGRVSTGKVWVDTVNEYAPVKGYYYFDETGRMYDDEFAVIDGAIYYLVDGQPYATGVSEIVEIDGGLYFVNGNGKVSTGKVWVDTVNEYAPVKGYYYFDETGKLIDGEFVTDGGALYYIVDGVPTTEGVFEVDGALYYASWNGKLAVNGEYYITDEETNGLIRFGYHDFDENGKMIG